MAPELRALMATVREDGADLHRTLEEDIRWPLLLHLVERERAIPVFQRRLAELAGGGTSPAVPAEALAALDRRARVERLRMLALERHLDRLLEVYDEAGAEVVLLKGAALRRSVYDDPAERSMSDLDVLVRPEEGERVWELARGLGWLWPEDRYPVPRYRRHHHLPPLLDGAGLNLKLEVHTHLLPEGHPFGFGAETVRRHAHPAPAGTQARIPRPDHLLLHASLHFAWSHLLQFGAWRTFRDVDALISKGGVEWSRFTEEVRASGAAPAAFWTLHLAKQWAGVPVPGAVLEELRPFAPRLARTVLERHFALRLVPDPDCPAPSWWLDRRLWEVALRPDDTAPRGVRPWDLDPGRRQDGAARPATEDTAGDGFWPGLGPPSGEAAAPAPRTDRGTRMRGTGVRYLLRVLIGR